MRKYRVKPATSEMYSNDHTPMTISELREFMDNAVIVFGEPSEYIRAENKLARSHSQGIAVLGRTRPNVGTATTSDWTINDSRRQQ